MSQSNSLESRCYGDPLAVLEKKRAAGEGRVMSARERSEIGNRPLRDLPRSCRASVVIDSVEQDIQRMRIDGPLKTSLVNRLDELRNLVGVIQAL